MFFCFNIIAQWQVTHAYLVVFENFDIDVKGTFLVNADAELVFLMVSPSDIGMPPVNDINFADKHPNFR